MRSHGEIPPPVGNAVHVRVHGAGGGFNCARGERGSGTGRREETTRSVVCPPALSALVLIRIRRRYFFFFSGIPRARLTKRPM